MTNTLQNEEARFERIAMPRVDIMENDSEIVLKADMPGVDEKNLSVTIEHGVLSLIGKVVSQPESGFELLRAERRADVFRREFELSDSVDAARITARIRNGLLTLVLPKREEVKPRKIEVTAA
jgi:HSP20 family protein